jgi:hypothetical protein
MTGLVALAVSIGLLGGIATALYMKVGLAIWAGFIAWACFFHTGGDTEALKKTIVGNLWGILCAAAAAWLLLSTNLGAAGPPVIVGITVLVLVLGAHFKPLATVPAAVYGYAATFAYLLQTAEAMVIGKLLMVDVRGNPILVVAISMVLGALFGWASAKMAASLTKQAAAA